MRESLMMMHRRAFLQSGGAVLLYGAGRGAPAQSGAHGGRVAFDERSVLVDGKRILLTCGSAHYPRSTRAMWPRILERSKSLGLNTLCTYVFWNVHEPTRDAWDFTGERDLGHYLDLCQEKGLAVFLRVGPYICAEWNFGGFPAYLRDEPGITIRTMNKPYTDRVQVFFERLAEVVLPRLASKGGPVILVQVENEYTNVAKRYGAAGQEYLRWIVELATRVGFAAVPTTTCEGGAKGAIETSNGFTIPPERIAQLRATRPGTPLLWTELYPSWYRVWGGGVAPARDPRSMAGDVLDFISRGGSGFNYYMWQGGSNFGRTSMYLQTPTYDFHAPLDEYGDITETGVYLGRLHDVLHAQSAILLEGERSDTVAGTQRTTTWKHGGDAISLVQDDYVAKPADFEHARSMNMHGRLLDGRGKALFDLDAAHAATARSFVQKAWKPVAAQAPSVWQCWDEPYPSARADAGVNAVEPVEQLSLTHDTTDYCWYSTVVEVEAEGSPELVIPYGGDFFYVYVDEHYACCSTLPLQENRGPITPDDPAHPRVIANSSEVGHPQGFRHAFQLPHLSRGRHRLDLLACAVGMVKGDWQIASPMNFERKGIWEGVLLDGAPLHGWTMRAGLAGERKGLPAQPAAIAGSLDETRRPLRWYLSQMVLPTAAPGGSAVFRLDANGLGKGMLWVNGHAVGRHWLIEAARPAGVCSQRYYHVPADWLRARNEVVIFEEQAALPLAVQLQMRG
jgi:beta-galactosidase